MNTSPHKVPTILALLLAGCALHGCGQIETVKVETSLGAVRGFVEDDVHKFLGMPFSEPRVGEFRWRAPVPVTTWSEPLDATTFGPWCSQFDYERRDEGQVDAGEGWTIFRNVPSNPDSGEDCLSLNVFTPDINGDLKPVLVFLHGNALGSSFPLYDGTDMAKAGVVYVSINFRLHSLGIFAHPALTAEAAPDEPLGRYAELDRLAALRWVQENIASFGGDPDQVTLAGSSEGGAAILQILSNPDASGLFHRAIVQSGNGWWEPMQHAEHEQLGCYLAELAQLDGCNATAEELRQLPWPQLPATGPFTIDNRTRHLGATDAIERGQVLDVPLMIGWNSFDGSSLRYPPETVISHTHPEVLSKYDANLPAGELAYELYTDLHAGAPARWIAHQLEGGAPVFLYLFSYVVSWDQGSVRGAQHGYEIPHALKTFDDQLNSMFPFLATVLLSESDEAMTQVMHACWVSFVKTGKPECPGAPDWPRYQRASDQLMELNLPPRVVTGYRAAQLDAQEHHRQHYFDQARASIHQLLNEGL